MQGIIYKIANKLDGMIYVGQTTRSLEERFREHAKADSHLGNAIRFHGEENFLREVIEECETREELNEREIFWIAHFNCKHPNGYNMTDGGEMPPDHSGEKNPFFGRHHTAEARAKMAAAKRGSKSWLGKHHTEASKAKMAAAKLGNKNGLGHHPTAEARAKMAAANEGIPKSPEHCAKVSEAKRGDSPFKNLLHEISKHNLSYRRLAKLMGISHQSLSRKMNRIRKFNVNEVAKLVEIFGLPAEYLMARDD